MEKIRFWVHAVAIVFGVGFLDGFLGIGLSDNVYILLGIVMLVAIIRLEILVKSK